MPLPDLDDGDPFAHCPGWHRFWHNKLHRPFWHHLALGGTWRRPDGWRGTNYPFPFIVLARHFRDWWRLAAFEGLCQTVCLNLCQRTFRRWVSTWASSAAADTFFAYTDDCGRFGFHHRGLLTVMRNGDGSDKVVTRRGRTHVRCSVEKVSRYDTRTRVRGRRSAGPGRLSDSHHCQIHGHFSHASLRIVAMGIDTFGHILYNRTHIGPWNKRDRRKHPREVLLPEPFPARIMTRAMW